MPTRTLTVLFTDMANYTAAVSSSDRNRLRQLISEHEEKVAQVLESSGGTVVKNSILKNGFANACHAPTTLNVTKMSYTLTDFQARANATK